jgi:hypothetical protein
MTISQTASLSKPIGSNKISSGTFAYVKTRNRQRAYDLVIREFKKSGLSQADLGRRLGKTADIISRLFSRPANWELDTFSELLFAITGGLLRVQADHPTSQQFSNRTTSVGRVVLPPQGGFVIRSGIAA